MEERLAVDETIERRHPAPSPNLAAPWLVIPFQEEGNTPNQAFYNICEPNKKSIRKSVPELSGRNRMYQKPSHQGWVVVYYDDDDDDDSGNFGNCFLWNPLSLEKIPLPNFDELIFDTYGEQDYRIHDCVLSSPPPKNNLVQDNASMVYFLVSGCVNEIYTDSMPMIAFCCVGDSEWRKLGIPKGLVGESGLNSFICFKDKIYVMGCDDYCQLVVQKLVPPVGCDYTSIRLEIRRLEVSIVHSAFSYIGGYSCVHNVYFLESDEEIYRIEMMCLDRRGYVNVVVSIDVSRLDFSKMSWEEVNRLGDTVLFLGQSTKCFCSAAALGLSKGCLYYTLPEDQSLYMFDVEDKCTTTILPCSNLPTPCYSSQWIMMPLPTFSVAVEGRIVENMSSKVRQDDYTVKAKKTEELIIKDDNENPRKRQKKEILQEPRWGVIHVDIVESIASHLHPVDVLHYRAVCKANKVPIMKKISGAIRSTDLTPWLLYSTENSTQYNFVDPMHNNEKYLMKLPELLEGASIRCQKGGWLLMSKGRFTLFFYNPFTKETIHLPGLSPGYEFAGVTFSSLPTCSDCVVIGINQQNEEDISICIIQRGANTWIFRSFQNSNLEKYMPTFIAPVIDKGHFFCADFNGTLGDMHGGDFEVVERPPGHSNAAYVSFLVKCETELLMVQMLGMSVTIYRLDSLNMVWQKVESLGKHMLFISFTSCLSAVAPKSCMENKVYFPRLHGDRILYYSLETGSYHSVGSMHCAKDYFDTKCWTNCTWIEPNCSHSTSKELNWLNKNPL
ncbi:uncharacterized protein LOC113308635 [Papaver somniferum]|nr:uncharacterized protein LOC113308635 [Papaver somniferum]